MTTLLNKTRELAIAILIGLIGLLIMSLIKGYTFLGDQELALQDRTYVAQANTRASRNAPPFLLLNLSQKAQYQLGYPPVTPRGLLSRLLTLAAQGQPATIVVDIDLGWSGDAQGEAELLSALASIAARNQPAVLLVRAPFSRTDGPPLDQSPAVEPDVMSSTPYDELVDRATNLLWVSALAPIDGDGLTRRYRIAPRVCRAGESLTLPSVQLATCAALSGPDRLAELDSEVGPGPPCWPDGLPSPPPVASSFQCAGREWPLGPRRTEADIAYRMSWVLPRGEARPQQQVTDTGIQVEELEIVDALDLLEHVETADPAALFAGRVVIIGSSAGFTGDQHRTALGSMPGMMVIANAIRSGIDEGPYVRSNVWLNILATLAISTVTYVSWAGLQAVQGARLLIVRVAAAPALNLFWIFLFTTVLPTSHVLEFLFPQFAVTLYLTVLEARSEVRSRVPRNPIATSS